MPTFLESLNAGLRRALLEDERVLLLGEDILDPYGGAFKVTRGLSTDFPGRVIATPVSEAGLLGVATGMALRGLRPVVEIMFGDFITLAADQLVNHAAKFRWMYNGQVRAPLVVRLPMGGRRGYGPTHSQSLEKLFLGVPGLRVLAPCTLGDPGELLLGALHDDDPVLFVEHKLLYPLALQDSAALPDFELQAAPPAAPGASDRPASQREEAPTYRLTVRGAPPPSLTLTAYGYSVGLALEAATRLAYEAEIFAEVIVPTRLAPFEVQPLLDSARRTGQLLAIEEGGRTMGWGAEILARTAESLGASLRQAGRVAGLDLPIPAAPQLEAAILPGVEEIFQAAKKMIEKGFRERA